MQCADSAQSLQALCLALTQQTQPISMSKSIVQDTLSDPDVPDAGAEAEGDKELARSWDLSSDSEGQHSPLKSKSLKDKGQTGEAMEEDLAWLPMLMTYKHLHQ